ncbi:MAG: hypothetical protein ACYCOU_03090 [Sulfobacillus sp.]
MLSRVWEKVFKGSIVTGTVIGYGAGAYGGYLASESTGEAMIRAPTTGLLGGIFGFFGGGILGATWPVFFPAAVVAGTAKLWQNKRERASRTISDSQGDLCIGRRMVAPIPTQSESARPSLS